MEAKRAPAPRPAAMLPPDPENEATVITPASSISPDQYPAEITPRELAHALRGQVLGHFLLQEFIGGGGMGVVFKAHDTQLDRPVAVKVLASQRIDSSELRRRFKVEAQSAARLDHPNIARVYESGVERGLPFIVFEYIEGANLREVVAANGPMELVDALRCAYHAALALTHAHQRKVIHRDIKPSNILITPTGETKLIDMGLARLKHASRDLELTATGVTLGTFDYLSPEQAADPRNADVRSDIYSLGCTLFFTLTGQAPFGPGTAAQKLIQHQNEPPPDVRDLRAEVPETVSLLIDEMLAKDPNDRPQHPGELAVRLSGLLADMGASVASLPATYGWTADLPAATHWQTWKPWLIAAAVMLAGIPLIDGYFRPVDATAPFDQTLYSQPAAEVAPAEAPDAVPASGESANRGADELIDPAVTAGGPATQSPAVDIDFEPSSDPPLQDDVSIKLSFSEPPEPSTAVDAGDPVDADGSVLNSEATPAADPF